LVLEVTEAHEDSHSSHLTEPELPQDFAFSHRRFLAPGRNVTSWILVMKVIGAASDGSGSQVSIKITVFAPGKKRRGKCVFRGPEAVAEQILPHSHVLLMALIFRFGHCD
jgi:hypothetical protein